MRVLVIEDEARLADVLARGLTEAGHEVEVARDGPDGLAAGLRRGVDVVVLDWMLPGLDGPGVCSALRAEGVATPVLMLTARHGVPDRVAGLDAGADDYLTKPFAFDELLARVRALGRRTGAGARLQVDDLSVDTERREVRRGTVAIELTAREFDLLALLASRPGRVVSRFAILDGVWDGETDVRSNVIEVHIANLRAKIDRPFGRATIQTLRGAGYRLGDGPA